MVLPLIIGGGIIANETVEYFTGEPLLDIIPSFDDLEEGALKVASFVLEWLTLAGTKIANFTLSLLKEIGIFNKIKQMFISFFSLLANPAVGSYLVAVLAVLFSFIAVWGKLKSGVL